MAPANEQILLLLLFLFFLLLYCRISKGGSGAIKSVGCNSIQRRTELCTGTSPLSGRRGQKRRRVCPFWVHLRKHTGRWVGVGWWGGAVSYVQAGLFTVERLSLGLVSVFFLLFFSSVYGERRGTTLPERKASFPRPQPSSKPRGPEGKEGGGDALSPIYVFHPAPCKHPA